jgi:hypothetical protein
MGRHAIIMQHTRDINVIVTKTFISFVIPTLDDKLGKFHSVETTGGSTVVKFFPADDARSTLKIEALEKILIFT